MTGNKPTTIGKWWRRTCLVFAPTPESESVEFTRRDLLLTLANSEGGAHVDAVLPPQYEKYVIDSPVKLMNNGIETDSVHLAQFAAVQAAAQMIDCINRLLA